VRQLLLPGLAALFAIFGRYFATMADKRGALKGITE
jgi:hypothetical protein